MVLGTTGEVFVRMEGHFLVGGGHLTVIVLLKCQCELVNRLQCPTYQLKGDATSRSVADGDVEEDALSL